MNGCAVRHIPGLEMRTESRSTERKNEEKRLTVQVPLMQTVWNLAQSLSDFCRTFGCPGDEVIDITRARVIILVDMVRARGI
jgi:hypothetical protein